MALGRTVVEANHRATRYLVNAGALVLAEIERLDRTATEQGSTCCKGGA
ncbi:hypothetical protein [Pseudomonas aeruginosa]